MDFYNKKVRQNLIMAIFLTLFFPIGVFGIIFGAANHITALLVVGIILTVLGFYGAPICWSTYGNKKSLDVYLRLILFENIYSLDDIATQTNTNKETVKQNILNLIQKGYLKGYILREDYLELNTNQKQSANTKKTAKCNNCGGTMTFDGINYVCEYCGHTERK